MESFDFGTKQATAKWLTSVLHENGFLFEGKVSAVEQKETRFDSFVSTFFSLKVGYSKSSSGKMPQNMIMKLVKPEFYRESEIDFYSFVSDKDVPLPLIDCYGTEKSPETREGYILLEDLSHTHYQTQHPIPPLPEQCKDAVSVLARVHAYWWNHTCFGEPNFVLPRERHLQRYFQQIRPAYSKFRDFLGDRLSEKRRKILDHVLDQLPELMWSRMSSPERLTLRHGDPHFWNFLFPNNTSEHECGRTMGSDWGRVTWPT